MDKYLTLRSTDCTQLYPDNQPWRFRVLLNEPIHSDQRWVIALVDISILNWDIGRKSECRDIYVYSSVCSASYVGDKKEPLLRRLCLMGNKRERTFEFVRGQYVPIRLSTIDSIDIDIKTESGDPASFIKGPVTLTLHLKPVPFWF